MVMIARILSKEIDQRLNSGKAIIILGARQVGKSSLLRERFANNNSVVWLEGDNKYLIKYNRHIFLNAKDSKNVNYRKSLT